jgi:hypothetical protein
MSRNFNRIAQLARDGQLECRDDPALFEAYDRIESLARDPASACAEMELVRCHEDQFWCTACDTCVAKGYRDAARTQYCPHCGARLVMPAAVIAQHGCVHDVLVGLC